MILIRMLVAILLLFQRSLAEDIVWELENYNHWNLPFAKTVEIKARNEGHHEHELATASYKLRVDPSSVISILFLEPEFFTDYNNDDLVVLDYTYLGNA